VDGTILPLLVMPNGAGFATGEYIYQNPDGTLTHGGITTDTNGKPQYYDESGKVKPYRFVYNYLDEKNAKISHAKI
jgi:hypothetical protein